VSGYRFAVKPDSRIFPFSGDFGNVAGKVQDFNFQEIPKIYE